VPDTSTGIGAHADHDDDDDDANSNWHSPSPASSVSQFAANIAQRVLSAAWEIDHRSSPPTQSLRLKLTNGTYAIQYRFLYATTSAICSI
jgi:hypothetical protein